MITEEGTKAVKVRGYAWGCDVGTEAYVYSQGLALKRDK